MEIPANPDDKREKSFEESRRWRVSGEIPGIPDGKREGSFEMTLERLLHAGEIDTNLKDRLMQASRVPRCRIPRRLVTMKMYTGEIVTEIGGTPLNEEDLKETGTEPSTYFGTMADYTMTRTRLEGKIVLFETPPKFFMKLFHEAAPPHALLMKNQFTKCVARGEGASYLGINIVDARGREFIFMSPHHGCKPAKRCTLTVHIQQIVTEELAREYALEGVIQ
jgi:hypothetical protein